MKIKRFIPPFLLSWYHLFLAFLGALIYGFPSKKLKVIGITGTKGKSTVVELTGVILEESGYKVASLSSIKFKIDRKEWPNKLKMTMPGRFKIQRFLRKAVKTGCQYAILEVTSEGILQHRQRFIDFDVALFTNLSPEHIERHGSFEKYRQAKGKLFEQCQKNHIINLDDKSAEYFLGFKANRKLGYGLKISNSNSIIAKNSQTLNDRIKFSIKNTEFNLALSGEFNIYNSLAAVCIGLSQGIDLEVSKKALEKVKGIPGRMETVMEKPFKVIVDYAHTPDSLEKVYQTVSSFQLPTSNLICVLGSCGGGRDKWKRPEMGKTAAKYCEKIILTNEDPYDEDPFQIINEIEQEIHGIEYVYKILDRRKAIRKALELAKESDVVIITGKGCEPWMCLADGRKIPWDDRKIVKEEYNLKT